MTIQRCCCLMIQPPVTPHLASTTIMATSTDDNTPPVSNVPRPCKEDTTTNVLSHLVQQA
jgi:hypothetical protein